MRATIDSVRDVQRTSLLSSDRVCCFTLRRCLWWAPTDFEIKSRVPSSPRGRPTRSWPVHCIFVVLLCLRTLLTRELYRH